MPQFKQNDELTYERNTYAEQNTFVGTEKQCCKIPAYDDIKHLLPTPVFDGHEDYIRCYDFAWRTAFSNLANPKEGTGFVSDFIDTAFNGWLFMWDSSFILMFAKYANRIFPFQKTLDNFYSHQHKDGFISREIAAATGTEKFTRHDPSSTGPNIMPLCEWQYFENFGDTDRLKRVYAPLRAYHIWLRKNRTWRDGSYYSCGWGCGMDNVPRLKEGYDVHFSHGRMIWSDICFQAIISCDILIRMNEALGSPDDVSDLIEERQYLKKLVNDKLWDENTKFYYDLWDSGEHSGVKHVGAYWSLLAKTMTKDMADGLVEHLGNEREFNRPTPIPTLSADHPKYKDNGGYWRGGVWAPTNYMTLCGLWENGYTEIARSIAEKYLDAVVKVYNKTGTLWENYAPERAEQGSPAKADFVGWTGLVPISVLFEYVFGIHADVPNGRIIWDVGRLEKHGILKNPFGRDCTLDLMCEARNGVDEEPVITVKANKSIEVIVRWNGKEKTIKV